MTWWLQALAGFIAGGALSIAIFVVGFRDGRRR